jgi:hypothetical protein
MLSERMVMVLTRAGRQWHASRRYRGYRRAQLPTESAQLAGAERIILQRPV